MEKIMSAAAATVKKTTKNGIRKAQSVAPHRATSTALGKAAMTTATRGTSKVTATIATHISELKKTNSESSITKQMGKLTVGGTNKSTGGKVSSVSRSGTIKLGSRKPASTVRQYSSSAGATTCKTVQDVVDLILKGGARNIVVMAGAGISTPSGIPDFRTPGTGLYDNLKQYKIPYPEAIFDIEYFYYNPRPFFTLAKELYPSGQWRPNAVHYFVRLLHEKGLLLRMYTQNIDGLERLAGIPPAKLVEAHGTFSMATCQRCRKSYPGEEIKGEIFDKKLPRCKKTGCNGIVKPDIVFFGEDLPRRFYLYLSDFPQADLLIVMGTSLEVEPFAGIVDSTRLYVPRLLINRDAVGPFKKQRRMSDVTSEGDLVKNVLSMVKMLDWTKELLEVQQTHESRSREQQTHQPNETLVHSDQDSESKNKATEQAIVESKSSSENSEKTTTGATSKPQTNNLTGINRPNFRSFHSLAKSNSVVRGMPRTVSSSVLPSIGSQSYRGVAADGDSSSSSSSEDDSSEESSSS